MGNQGSRRRTPRPQITERAIVVMVAVIYVYVLAHDSAHNKAASDMNLMSETDLGLRSYV